MPILRRRKASNEPSSEPKTAVSKKASKKPAGKLTESFDKD